LSLETERFKALGCKPTERIHASDIRGEAIDLNHAPKPVESFQQVLLSAVCELSGVHENELSFDDTKGYSYLHKRRPATKRRHGAGLHRSAFSLSSPESCMMTLAAIRRCREGRENRPQSRCGNGSQFHNAPVSDDQRAKSI
jgi:hypothetical protein